MMQTNRVCTYLSDSKTNVLSMIIVHAMDLLLICYITEHHKWNLEPLEVNTNISVMESPYSNTFEYILFSYWLCIHYKSNYLSKCDFSINLGGFSNQIGQINTNYRILNHDY